MNGPLEYVNRDGRKGVYGALVTGWKPPRFDIRGEDLMTYFHEPLEFTVKLRYTVDG